MGCFKISDKARKLRQDYFNMYEKMPRGWYYQEDETMEEYEKYLEKELSKSNK